MAQEPYCCENCDFLADRVDDLEAENASLRAIVAKLPKTADGVPVTPGMTLYLFSNNGMNELDVDHRYMHPGDFCWYSTPEAAKAAFDNK